MSRFVQVLIAGIPGSAFGQFDRLARRFPPLDAGCQAPDGGTLLCLVSDRYTRPLDLTAAAVSVAIGLAAATQLLHLYAARATWGANRSGRDEGMIGARDDDG